MREKSCRKTKNPLPVQEVQLKKQPPDKVPCRIFSPVGGLQKTNTRKVFRNEKNTVLPDKSRGKG